MKPSAIAPLFCLMMMTSALAGCIGGTDTATPNEELDDWSTYYVASAADLPNCDSDTLGRLYYVVATADFHACTATGWIVVDLTGAPGADGISGADGAPGADGNPGADGAPGMDGLASLGVITPEPAGTNCAEGGISFAVGIDDDDDATLDASEIDQTKYVCNGATGSSGGSSSNTMLTSISTPPVEECDAGGRIVNHGLDNGDDAGVAQNGILESGEVDFTTTYCSSNVIDFMSLSDVVSVENFVWNTFKKFNNELYFLGSNGFNGTELWKSDGTISGTVMVKNIAEDYDGQEYSVDIFNYGSSCSSPEPCNTKMHVVGNTLYFWADDGVHGYELWKTDGTESGTNLVKDIYSGSESSISTNWYQHSAVTIGNEIFFWAENDVSGIELWKSDGSESGTTLVKDIFSGSEGILSSSEASNPQPPLLLQPNGNTFYFIADYPLSDGTPAANLAMWKSDGTEAGTVVVKEEIGLAYISSSAAIGDTLFLTGDDPSGDDRIWKTDGTEANTGPVTDINPNGNDNARRLKSFDNAVYFQANDGVHGDELWKSDGTATGTEMVIDINVGSGSSMEHGNAFSVFNNALYFYAYSQDSSTGQYEQRWKSDGTEAGTEVDTGFIPFSGYTPMFIDEGQRFAWNEQTQSVLSNDEQYTWIITDGTTIGTSSFTTQMMCYDGMLIGNSIFCAYYDEYPEFELMIGPMIVDVEHEITYT